MMTSGVVARGRYSDEWGCGQTTLGHRIGVIECFGVWDPPCRVNN